MTGEDLPYWKRKKLTEMTDTEWEGLCDGCAKCCLHKLQDEDTGNVYYTNVACRMLDCDSCTCIDYPNRQRFVPNCVKLSPGNIEELFWMPSTCAYKLLAEGKDLPDWHPLLTGDPNSVHKAGVSAKDRCIPEIEADTDLNNHVVSYFDDDL